MSITNLNNITFILSNDVIDLVQTADGKQYELHEFSEITQVSTADLLKTLPIVHMSNVYEIED